MENFRKKKGLLKQNILKNIIQKISSPNFLSLTFSQL